MVVRGLIIVCISGLGLIGDALADQNLKPGLIGTYFSGEDFTRPEDDTEILVNIDHDWEGSRGNDWSARWKGLIEGPITGEVTFEARAVDGVRLLINGKVIIDGLKDSAARSGRVVLEKQKMTPITLEYVSLKGQAQLHLYWRWKGHKKTIIPPNTLWYRPTKLEEQLLRSKEIILNTRNLRERLLRDPHRPGYHFVTPEGRCGPFDINAAIFWKGRYHLFYIFQNQKGHCWGHASSIDLVHWRHHPTALAPGEGDKGIFSGGAFIDKNGIPTITYWGLDRGICIATSTHDQLETWTKSPHNPVIRETHFGYAVVEGNSDGAEKLIYGVADPSAIWSHKGRYCMLTGNLLVLRKFGQKQNQPQHLGDTTYLFVSDDLINWKYLHPFYQSDRKWTRDDEDNMCPDFFPLPTDPDRAPAADRHMLLFISHNLGCQYYIGRYTDDHFYPETHGRMTWVDRAFFAPESMLDARGRRIMWAWIHDGRKKAAKKSSDWSGTLSLPRILYLGEDNTLRILPPKELEILRYNPKTFPNLTVKADSQLPLKDVRGNSIELSLEMVPNGAAQFGVKVCVSPDAREQTLIFYDPAERMLKIDTNNSSLGGGPKSVESAPLKLNPDEPLKLRVFVDKSVVEVFANNRQAVTRRIYPTKKQSLGIALFSTGGSTRITNLHAWDITPANPY